MPANGSHDAPAAEAAPQQRTSERPREAPEQMTQPREYHSEPRESSPVHEAPLAHFEPQPKPDPGSGAAKPYVVWSSTPADASERGTEE